MKMQVAWILGATTVALLGVGGTMVGCSSSNNNNDPPDTGSPDVAQADHYVASPDGGGTMDSGCKSDPNLHMTAPGSLFCGYDDAGNTFTCEAGTQCCLGGKTGSTYAPEMCATWGGACPNPAPDGGLPIQCEQTSDCEANGKQGFVCCLQAATPPTLAAPGCDSADLKSSDGTGIFCEQGPSCTLSGDLQVCESQAECGDAGKVCTPIRWKLYEIGVCM